MKSLTITNLHYSDNPVGGELFMKEKSWVIFVDVVTINWLVVFAVGVFTSNEVTADRCEFITLLLLPVFVIDLFVLLKRADNFRSFIKQHWFDILIVIPYFRVFRLLKFARVLRALRLIKLARFLGITRAVRKTKRVTKTVKITDK
jgi:voltage-gated potassium channel